MDMAIQHTGSVESLIDIVSASNISVTDVLEPGTVLTVPEVVNRRVTESFSPGKAPATAPDAAMLAAEEGIDYWTIEVDFIIQ